MSNDRWDGTEDYNDPVNDRLNDGDRDGGQLEDADESAMSRWAESYDALNGAPENDEDR